ncbi:MAG: T9SS type A sorting domain-containing protein [Candidatus Azobacteroides sp.]|nr:T9SS type A sorting domain-containing protein [Candidatus Azobacteroides sp.]
MKTPNNSVVQDTYILTSTDISYTSAQLSALANDLQVNYNGAELIDAPSYKYNCHAYAWHVSEGGDKVWIGLNTVTSEDIYWTDGSYMEVSENIATKVSYHQNGNHSAIRLNSTWYQSKWGASALVKHHPNDVPSIYQPSMAKKYYIRQTLTPTLSGSATLCLNSSATYTINNFPTNATVTWSQSSNLQQVSGSGASKVYKGIANGAGWIQATVNGTVLKQDIWVGVPPTNIPVRIIGKNSDYISSGMLLVCPGELITLIPQFPQSAGSILEVESQATNCNLLAASSSMVKFTAPSVAKKSFSIRYRYRNECGWSAWDQITGNTMNCAGGEEPFSALLPIILIPNPAFDQVSIEINDNTDSRSDTMSGELSRAGIVEPAYTVTIVDASGIPVYTGKKKGKTFDLSVSSLRNGFYYVIVSDGVNTYREKLMINH